MKPFYLLIAATLHLIVQHSTLAEQPNILWINAEDMSPHLGCYGHPDAHTPHIDALARQGMVYQNAFATAPICSPARSCLATGLYATSLGTQHLRCEVQIPDQVIPLAVRLRKLGYFCTNTGKSDYNFSPEGIWDAWSNESAPWRRRNPGQPFFGFITIGETHEGRINLRDRYLEAVADLPPEQRHDPRKVTIPPFYPDTPEIRDIFAGMHDLATVFDRKVGAVIAALKADGDLDNTIVFVFGDHGNGLPRYKRWLNDSGLRVPLVVYLPKSLRSLCSDWPQGADAEAYSTTDRLVSFVDFPATALRLAGAETPNVLQGIPFLGEGAEHRREYVFGARSRADDMFEVSRSVSDGRYFYVRHFLPHLPYIQDSVIFGDRKAAFRELRKLHHAGELPEHANRLWSRSKPVEELYDLQSDPHELVNLANSPEHGAAKQRLATRLRDWAIEHRDTGFLTESEYQIRAANRRATPMDVIRDPSLNLKAIVSAAWRVGDPAVDVAAVVNGLRDEEAGVRYWSAVACTARMQLADSDVAKRALEQAIGDTSPSVRIAAAEALLNRQSIDPHEQAKSMDALRGALEDPRPWVALEAASTMARLGPQVKPLVQVMKRVSNSQRSAPGSPRPYKNFNYASFTGWALETALLRCGEDAFVDAISQ